jgi:hypothetical protein
MREKPKITEMYKRTEMLNPVAAPEVVPDVEVLLLEAADWTFATSAGLLDCFEMERKQLLTGPSKCKKEEHGCANEFANCSYEVW